MAGRQTERGVNEISKGEKNLDSEFKKKTPGATGKRAPVGKSNKKKSKKAKSKRRK